MYGFSKNIFMFFLWITASSLSAIMFYAGASAVLPDAGKAFSWINIAIYVLGGFGTLFYSSRKLPRFFKFLFLAILVFGTCFGGKYIIDEYFTVAKTPVLSNSYFGIYAIIVFLFLFWPLSFLSKRFWKIFPLLEGEKDHKTKESYQAWLTKEATGDPKQFLPSRTVTFLLNFGLWILAILFLAIAKTPPTSGTFTVFILLYAFGSLGIYFILYQFSSLLKWKLMGYKTDETIVRNWNNLIILFFIPIIVIPLLIPWNYSIVKTSVLTEFVNVQFGKITEMVASGYIEKTADLSDQGMLSNRIMTYNNQQPEQSQEAFWNVVKFVLLIVVAFLAVYTVLGLIGWALFNKYKYSKKPPLVQFLINRYYKLKNFFDILGGLFSPIGNLIARMLGLRKPEEEEETQKLEKHLYTYFESIKDLPSEKQEEIRTIIREFVRLLQTSSRLITPYYFFQGPMEYTEKVIDLVPTLAIDLRKVTSVFNESRYSLHMLKDEIKADFQQTVDSLIATIERERVPAKS